MTSEQTKMLLEAREVARRSVAEARARWPEAVDGIEYDADVPEAVEKYLRATWANAWAEEAVVTTLAAPDVNRALLPDKDLPNYRGQPFTDQEREQALWLMFQAQAAEHYGLVTAATVEARSFVSLGTLPEPGPRLWTVSGLIPEKAVTILVGHSGVGKSYIALYLAMCVCLGRRFFGREVVKGSALWVDRELDQEETLRRAYQVARGMGLPSPPAHLYYAHPEHPVGSDAAQRHVMEAVQETEAALIVLDSLTVGSTGDASEQRDVVKLMKQVEAWGTVLAIDHFTKAGAAGNQSAATIFGSTFKRAIARSTIRLTQADGGALTLRPDKSNFGPATSALHFKADHLTNEYGEPEVVFTSVTETDESMLGAEAHAPAHEQTLIVLKRLYLDRLEPVPLALLAAEREAQEKTVRNHLSQLKKDGLIRGFADNTYEPVEPDDSRSHSRPGTAGNGTGNGTHSSFPVPKGEGTGNGSEVASTSREGHSRFPIPIGQGTGNGTDQPTEPEPWVDEVDLGLEDLP
jgi:hypothetical protein